MRLLGLLAQTHAIGDLTIFQMTGILNLLYEFLWQIR